MGPDLLTYCPSPQKDGEDPSPQTNDCIEFQNELAAAFLLGFWAARLFPNHIPGNFGLTTWPMEVEKGQPAKDQDHFVDQDGHVWQDHKIPNSLALKMAEYLASPPADPNRDQAAEALAHVAPEPPEDPPYCDRCGLEHDPSKACPSDELIDLAHDDPPPGVGI